MFKPTPLAAKVFTDNYQYNGGQKAMLFVFRYMNGALGLAVDEEFGPEAISINLPDQVAGENCVFIKDYSEHEGLIKSLVAGNVGTVVRPVGIGWGSGHCLRLSFDAEAIYPMPSEREL